MKERLINIDPEIMSGTPVFAGTRVPVKNLFDYIGTGETLEEFLDDFPSVKKQQAVKVLDMAMNIILSKEFYHENSPRRMHSTKTRPRSKRV